VVDLSDSEYWNEIEKELENATRNPEKEDTKEVDFKEVESPASMAFPVSEEVSEEEKEKPVIEEVKKEEVSLVQLVLIWLCTKILCFLLDQTIFVSFKLSFMKSPKMSIILFRRLLKKTVLKRRNAQQKQKFKTEMSQR
jgi:hypothetical protein